MMHVTLPDGTRTQIDAADITDIEATLGGSLIHMKSGEVVRVLQNAQVVAARLKIVWDGTPEN